MMTLSQQQRDRSQREGEGEEELAVQPQEKTILNLHVAEQCEKSWLSHLNCWSQKTIDILDEIPRKRREWVTRHTLMVYLKFSIEFILIRSETRGNIPQDRIGDETAGLEIPRQPNEDDKPRRVHVSRCRVSYEIYSRWSSRTAAYWGMKQSRSSIFGRWQCALSFILLHNFDMTNDRFHSIDHLIFRHISQHIHNWPTYAIQRKIMRRRESKIVSNFCAFFYRLRIGLC